MTSAGTIDRVAPTLQPDAPVLMHQNWHHLLFLHWEVPALTVDTFEGNAYVGLVPFTMTGVRPILAPPLPWISSFHKVNVRTYVHRDGRGRVVLQSRCVERNRGCGCTRCVQAAVLSLADQIQRFGGSDSEN